MNTYLPHQQAPSKAFRFAAIAALVIGAMTYLIGLFNAEMALNEKGYYLIILMFGLFSAVSVQKAVRDKSEGIKTSSIYYLLAWLATGSSIALLCLGLYNAELLLSEKGFFGMAFVLSLFAAITVQKNVRDSQAINEFEASNQGIDAISGSHEAQNHADALFKTKDGE
jgi:uncharacterized membrane protein YiaA